MSRPKTSSAATYRDVTARARWERTATPDTPVLARLQNAAALAAGVLDLDVMILAGLRLPPPWETAVYVARSETTGGAR